MAISDWAPDRDLPRGVWLPALVAIVLFAVYLRFSALAWGLRHPVHTDESSYVANAVKMVEAGDLDHRFYQAPGLFFYILAPALAWLGPDRWGGPDAYLVSRGVVAAFGVLNVLLAFGVGARLVGRWAGLAAALSLAVSPVDIQMSHQVRQDGVLQTFGLLAILAWRRIGGDRRYDALAGLVVGLATAVKFTGLLLIPSYLAARFLAPGRRANGILLAGAVGIVALVASTPYSLVNASKYVAGPARLLRIYYPGQGEGEVLPHLALLVGAGLTTLGMAGSLLAGVGVVLALRAAWRSWLPPLLHPLTTILVLSTGSLVFDRYVLPAMGIVHLMVGMTIDRVARRRPVGALLLTGLAVIPPAWISIRYVERLSLPSAQDQALDWILSHVPAGAHVLESRPDATPGGRPGAMVGVPSDRYEIVASPSPADTVSLRLLASEVDLVIEDPKAAGRWATGLETLYAARNPKGTLVFNLMAMPDAQRPRYEPVDLRAARLSTSDNQGAAPRLYDGDLGASWSSARPRTGREWIQVVLDKPTLVGRVELVLPGFTGTLEPELALLTSEDGETFRPRRAADARAALAGQPAVNRPMSQVLLLAPRPIRALRILQRRAAPEPWEVAELRVLARR